MPARRSTSLSDWRPRFANANSRLSPRMQWLLPPPRIPRSVAGQAALRTALLPTRALLALRYSRKPARIRPPATESAGELQPLRSRNSERAVSVIGPLPAGRCRRDVDPKTKSGRRLPHQELSPSTGGFRSASVVSTRWRRKRAGRSTLANVALVVIASRAVSTALWSAEARAFPALDLVVEWTSRYPIQSTAAGADQLRQWASTGNCRNKLHMFCNGCTTPCYCREQGRFP